MLHTVPSEFEANTFIIDSKGKTTSYREFAEAQEFFQKGIDQRVVVLVLCESTPGAVMGLMSFLMNGQIPLLVESNIEMEFVLELISGYQIEYIFLAKKDRNKFPNFKTVSELRDFVLLKTGMFAGEFPHNELALLLSTSGSTGSAKLVRLSYKNILSNGRSIINYLNLHQKDRAITTLPLSYSYGFSILSSHFLAGASLVLTRNSVLERGFWDSFEKYKPTSLSGVPFTFEMLKRVGFFTKIPPSALHSITQAGGKMSNEVTREIAAFATSNKIKFFVMYGQTEATARISFLDPGRTMEKIGSIGKAIPGGKLELTKLDSDAEPGSGSFGELVYYGPNVMLGYANSRIDLGKGDELMGRLLTGDLASVDRDGFFYIVGRMKRNLKFHGKRVNLDEVEVLLRKQFGDLACCGIDDNLAIFSATTHDILDIKRYACKKFKLNHTVVKAYQIVNFPRLANGKIDYRALETLINET